MIIDITNNKNITDVITKTSYLKLYSDEYNNWNDEEFRDFWKGWYIYTPPFDDEDDSKQYGLLSCFEDDSVHINGNDYLECGKTYYISEYTDDAEFELYTEDQFIEKFKKEIKEKGLTSNK